jgi:predicted nucleic-acid-binding protein
MTGLDTNVVIRYLMHDDPTQTSAAVKLVSSLTAEEPGFLSLIVVVEMVWVLESTYGFSKQQIEEVLETLLRGKELRIERADLVAQALRTFHASRADFSDCLIERCAHAAGCSYTATFDRAASIAGMRLLT